MSELRTVHLQLERLRRNYDAVVGKYDEISLWELSSTLRIWADMREDLPKLVPTFASTVAFKTSTFAPKAYRAARGLRYVFASLPGGVITRAANGVGAAFLDDGGPFVHGAMFRQTADYAELKNYSFISGVVPEDIRHALRDEQVRRCNFHQWLTSECIRVAFKDDQADYEQFSISREDLIRRLANSHDGSHPSISSYKPFNELNGTVKHLFNYTMGHLPLPYFCMLKFAQDLLDIAPKLLA